MEWNGGMEWWNGIVECVLQGERSLLLQFFIDGEVCNHGPEGSELHKQMKYSCYGYFLSTLPA